jgi:hypothetical protein
MGNFIGFYNYNVKYLKFFEYGTNNKVKFYSLNDNEDIVLNKTYEVCNDITNL